MNLENNRKGEVVKALSKLLLIANSREQNLIAKQLPSMPAQRRKATVRHLLSVAASYTRRASTFGVMVYESLCYCRRAPFHLLLSTHANWRERCGGNRDAVSIRDIAGLQKSTVIKTSLAKNSSRCLEERQFLVRCIPLMQAGIVHTDVGRIRLWWQFLSYLLGAYCLMSDFIIVYALCVCVPFLLLQQQPNGLSSSSSSEDDFLLL